MPRTEPVHAWWIASLTTIVYVYACANDGAARAPNAEESPDASELSDASEPSDAAALPDADAASAVTCPTPIPEGDLQEQASGPSVFGRVVSSELGWYDPRGIEVCGVAGVRICLFDTETCTESDDAGQFVLNGLPSDVDLEITLEKAGFFSVLRLTHMQAAPVNLRFSRILSLSDRQTLLDSIDASSDPAKGGLIAVALEPGEAIGTVDFPEGVEITLLPGDIEPHYSLGMLEPAGLSSDELDPELESTRVGGWASFFALDPGDYTLRFERDGSLCSFVIPGLGFGADEQGHIRVRIREGFNTIGIAALCQ